jgi:hypothetical protein
MNRNPKMPRIREMILSKYLKKEDCEPALLVTIREIVQEEVGIENDKEEKWICYFEEQEKGIVLNSTNMRLIEKITGSDDTDDWIGVKIVLYSDPNISFQGKLVGGIRVRAPKAAKTAKKAAKSALGSTRRGDPAPNEPIPAEANEDDAIPF